jgi:battenin
LASRNHLQLLGVSVVAFQGGLGEATVLALCARHPPTDAALTAWSSGTGFAGVFGYLWVAALRAWLGLSFRATLLLANVTAAMWLAAYAGLSRRGGGGGGEGGGGGGESAGREPVEYERVATSTAGELIGRRRL